jgi:hypothetical protein
MAAPGLWRWYLWYLLASAPIVFLGSVVYLAVGTWVMRFVFALGGGVFSACMVAGGICGLRWRPQSSARWRPALHAMVTVAEDCTVKGEAFGCAHARP